MSISEMYDIPQQRQFRLSEIETLGIMQKQQSLKLIKRGELMAVSIGNKYMIPRAELVRFLDDSKVETDALSDTVDGE